ncbi:helix-turn-helix domain-containing protein [Umezawaea endophytica]|uniref:Helix-turn-helix domain-containing protein n=1 Tax=Umezawaea endophytica TaxID=1654476 RepID=A0A9X2VGP8_9PSEU|nr:helix-turn-helix domain-containing protein [Umezawaea endophytica]MCS7476127.1 helix-turn-helix domain-containing protein [Umezawaea endophytica]
MGTGFGARLRATRQRRGLAQKDLACPGVSMSYVSRLESGHRTPSSQVVRKLAALLEVDPSELVGDRTEVAQDLALAWCEALIAYHDGDVDRAVDLLALLGPRTGGEVFGWCVQWTRVMVQSRLDDGAALLRVADLLRTGWSPGPAVDALVEIQRAAAFRVLGRPNDAVRAARLALDLTGRGGGDQVARVRVRALIALCSELVAAGRTSEAEAVADRLGDEVRDLGCDRLLISSWWVRARVFDRLGDRAAAARCMDRAHELAGTFTGDHDFRCRVRLAWAAIGLRAEDPDLDRIAAGLDEVEATPFGRSCEVTAQAKALRAEVLLRHGELDGCERFARQALDIGGLGQEDRLRCALLLVRVADESDDACRDARALLVGLLDDVAPEAVDPVLWRDVARVALRQH